MRPNVFFPLAASVTCWAAHGRFLFLARSTEQTAPNLTKNTSTSICILNLEPDDTQFVFFISAAGVTCRNAHGRFLFLARGTAQLNQNTSPLICSGVILGVARFGLSGILWHAGLICAALNYGRSMILTVTVTLSTCWAAHGVLLLCSRLARLAIRPCAGTKACTGGGKTFKTALVGRGKRFAALWSLQGQKAFCICRTYGEVGTGRKACTGSSKPCTCSMAGECSKACTCRTSCT